MTKAKNQKKKSGNKVTVKAITNKLNSKKKYIKNTNNINTNSKYKKNNKYKPGINKYSIKKVSKTPIKKSNEKIKPFIYDQELENVDIPIIQKTIDSEKDQPKKEVVKEELNNKEETLKIEEVKPKIEKNNEIEITHEELEEKIEAKIDEKLDAKIEEKLQETEEILLPATEDKIKEEKIKKPNPSRKIAQKEDVFSKLLEWFKNLTSDETSIRKRKVTNIKKYDKKKKNKKVIEEKTPKIYPKNKFLKALVIIHDNLYIPFDTIVIIAFIILMVGLNRVQVIPDSTIKYIACITGFLSIVAISLNKYISGRIFSIIITAGMVCGIYYLNDTYDFINNLNSKLYEYKEYYVVALDNGRNKSIYNINNKRVGLLKDNSRNVIHVLNTKLDHITYITYANQDKLYEEFINNGTRAIIVKENQYKYIQNNNIKPDVKVKILYKFNVNTKKIEGE